MALSATLLGSPAATQVVGSQRQGTFTVNLGTYATNGVAFTPATFGLVRVDYIDIGPAGGYLFEVDYTNSKIKAYRQKDPAAAGGADIALPEVANGVDISAVTFRALVIGA
jgi:hypothetical protein